MSIQDLVEKSYKFNGLYAPKEMIDRFIDAILNSDPGTPMTGIIETIKELASTNIHSEIEFI